LVAEGEETVMTQVYISDIWMDRAGKFWRVVLARAGEEMVTIGACGRNGRFAIGWREIRVPRNRFVAEHEYVAHAHI
jgi:hypothetical protein